MLFNNKNDSIMHISLNYFFNPIIRWLTHERPLAEVPLSNFEKIRKELKPCDVILIEGRARISNVIKLITQSPWSHAALYIGTIQDIDDPRTRDIIRQHYDGPADAQLMIESDLGIGTVIRPVTVYEREHLRICRPKGLTQRDGQDVIRYALSRLGYDYDVRQILDLARFLFPWTIMPRRWRSSLFTSNVGGVTKTVCSTLIAESFSFVQFPILPLVKQQDSDKVQLYQCNPKLSVPSLFDYSPYFEIIKYPFIDYSHHEEYQLLPWTGVHEHGYTKASTYAKLAQSSSVTAKPEKSDANGKKKTEKPPASPPIH